MFKKPLHDLKTSAPLKGSERKKLRQRVVDYYQIDATLPESESISASLVPEGILSAKFSSHQEDHGVLYLDGQGLNDPLWFTVGKGSTVLIPTVYTLWKYPRLLPVLSTPKLVIPKLLNGADLMAPGVVTCPGGIQQDQIVSIAEYSQGSRSCPVAVGTMAIDSDRLGDYTKGKAVYTLHVEGDELWAMGSKTSAPLLLHEQLEEAPGQRSSNVLGTGYQGSEGQETLLEGKIGTTHPQVDNSEASKLDNQLSPEEVSKVLRSALIQAIKDLPPGSLPINSSTFYSNHILPSRPSYLDSDTPIDIKHSNHKNLSQFLKAVAQEGLIKSKEQKGEIVITHVFADSPDVIAHVPYRTMAAVAQKEEAKREKREAEGAKPKEIIVSELWKGIGSSHLQSFFKEVGKEPSQLYSPTDLRGMINTYIATNSLPNPKNQSLVRLDPLLNALLVPSNGNIDELRREDILIRLCGNMQPWYSISQGEKSVTKKGSLAAIQIATKQRQGRKVVTCVSHFEGFFIEATALSEELKLKCASSTSVSELPGKQNTLQEVMVQGNHVSTVVDVLLAKGVSKKWIEVQNAVKKK